MKQSHKEPALVHACSSLGVKDALSWEGGNNPSSLRVALCTLARVGELCRGREARDHEESPGSMCRGTAAALREASEAMV